jgi:predicted transcriptional regulator
MQGVKDRVCKLVRHMPDDCSIEDIIHQLYVLEKVERGLRAVKRGETVSQDEVEREFRGWLSEK